MNFLHRPLSFHNRQHTFIMNKEFKLTIHMVASLDGVIAKKDNSISWFETKDHFEKGIELTEQQTQDFLKTIDCYIMGANTYLHALHLSKQYGWAYGDVPVIVVTSRGLPVTRESIELFSGELKNLVNEKLKTKYSSVWLVGGAMLAKEFMRLNLADEIRLSVLPIVLGDGLYFFNGSAKELALHLKEVNAYKNGMVELYYEIKKDAII